MFFVFSKNKFKNIFFKNKLSNFVEKIKFLKHESKQCHELKKFYDSNIEKIRKLLMKWSSELKLIDIELNKSFENCLIAIEK
jgi:hypothetical protein